MFNPLGATFKKSPGAPLQFPNREELCFRERSPVFLAEQDYQLSSYWTHALFGKIIATTKAIFDRSFSFGVVLPVLL